MEEEREYSAPVEVPDLNWRGWHSLVKPGLRSLVRHSGRHRGVHRGVHDRS